MVERAPASANDVALGIPGSLLLINTSFQNLGLIQVEGIDGALQYVSPETSVGAFTFRMDGAYLHSFEQQASAAEPVRELVGTFARPTFRGRAQVGWRLGGFEVVSTLNYTDSYEDITADRTVDYSTTVDLLVEYRFGKGQPAEAPVASDGKLVTALTEASSRRSQWLRGLTVRGGVRNIFDDPPPFSNNVAGYPVPLEDPRQRFFFVDIEKRF